MMSKIWYFHLMLFKNKNIKNNISALIDVKQDHEIEASQYITLKLTNLPLPLPLSRGAEGKRAKAFNERP